MKPTEKCYACVVTCQKSSSTIQGQLHLISVAKHSFVLGWLILLVLLTLRTPMIKGSKCCKDYMPGNGFQQNLANRNFSESVLRGKNQAEQAKKELTEMV